MLVGCSSQGGKESETSLVTMKIGDATFEIVYEGNNLQAVRVSGDNDSYFVEGEAAKESRPMCGASLDEMDSVLAELGMTMEDVKIEKDSRSLDEILDAWKKAEKENVKVDKKPDTEDKDENHNKGKWTLHVWDFSTYDITLCFEDGKLYLYDFYFSKSGEDDEDVDRAHYEGDSIAECEYANMSLEEIENVIKEMAQDYGLKMKWSKTK